MELGYGSLALIGLIVVLAYVVVGTTGFGASITSVPLLVHLLPLTTVVPMMVVFDLCAGLLLGGRNFQAINRRELLRLLPFMLVGIVLGVTLLVSAPERILLLTLGVAVLCYAAWSLWGRPPTAAIDAFWSMPLGTIGGVFSALFGTGGPIYTIYLARRIGDKRVLRATISTLIFISALARFGALVAAGVFAQRQLLLLTGLMLPCMLLGLFAGNRLHDRLPAKQVVRIIWSLLLVSSSSLIWRSV
ncbi:MAG: sulfite exporter TauE/SafE family protein [Lautropia sp.]|nr:sulfite exporter TauE/SafE family protein [Lautropia sp.]